MAKPTSWSRPRTTEPSRAIGASKSRSGRPVVPRPRGSSHRPLVILSGMLPVVLAAVLVLYRPSLLRRLDDSTYDVLLRSAHARPPAAGVVIVDVDERSLTAVGQWPWRRDVVGRLISRLKDAGAAVIALDIIFAESDRYGQNSEAWDTAADLTTDGTLSAG